MQYGEAISQPKSMKKPKNQLREMVLRKADNGGIVAEHRMSSFGGKVNAYILGQPGA